MMSEDTTGYIAVKAAMAAVGCSCTTNDAQTCYDTRYPGERRAYEAIGIESEGCECRCHDIWDEWMMEKGDGE